MRIVLDTSALISGFLWTGPPRRLLDAVIARQLTPAVLAARYRAIAESVIPAEIGSTVVADPDDDQVLACALAARADLIVSGDADLLNLKLYQRIPIVDPVEALRRVGQLS